ncbi:MAG: aminotransferase class V-fold PLP-dependent enzyme [Gammaproteobacteria bacterium]|nr:aminotransferase class V-fold PLP-dependent enzyme [Gammaproteobacteria bacterium]
MKIIYLDFAATTPVDARVLEKMSACMTIDGIFANPASQHAYGNIAREYVEWARVQVADYLHATPEEIIWTSGATESNNLALKGAAWLSQKRGKHLITMKTEHKSVLDSCQHLEKEGFAVTYLQPDERGVLVIEELIKALRPDTILVSIMHVNNETGVVQPIAEIADILHKRGILFHVDAAQSIGKIPLNLDQLLIPLVSLSAHKVYGPKGIGALYVRKKPRTRVMPLIHGGGHEQGMRSGTLPTHQIVGMGEAYAIAAVEQEVESKRITHLRQQLLSQLEPLNHLITKNTPVGQAVPHIISLRIKNTIAKMMLEQLPELALSTASACQGKGSDGSYVLRAMGLTDAEIQSAIRISLGRFTVEDDITRATHAFKKYLLPT